MKVHIIPFVLLLSVVLCTSVQAQHEFQTVIPGLTPAAKRPVVQTPDGGFCVLAKQDDDNFQSHLVLLKATSDGLVEWCRQFPVSERSNTPVALRMTSDGSFIVMGTSIEQNSSTEHEGDQLYNHDILLMKISTHGYPMWSRVYNWSMQDQGMDMVILDNDNVVVLGATQKTDTLNLTYDEPLYTEERWKGLVLCADNEGNTLWSQRLLDFPASCRFEVVEQSLGTSLSVRSDSTISVAFAMEHHFDRWSSLLLRLSTTGSVMEDGIWLRTWRTEPGWGIDEGEYSTFINDIATLPNGEYVIAGVTGNTFDSLNAGFLIKLSEQDSIAWNRTYLNHHPNGPPTFSVLPTGDAGFLIAGRTPAIVSYDGVNGYADEIDNPIIARTDESGALMEATQLITSFEKVFPIPDDAFGRAGSYLGNPQFIVTEDMGTIAVGEIVDIAFVSPSNLYLTRFNADLTTCGDNATQRLSTTPSSVLTETESYFTGIGSWNEWLPVDGGPMTYSNFISLPPPPPTPYSGFGGPAVPIAETNLVSASTIRHQIDSPPILITNTAPPLKTGNDSIVGSTITTNMISKVQNIDLESFLAHRPTKEPQLLPEESLEPISSRVEISLQAILPTTRTLAKLGTVDINVQAYTLCAEDDAFVSGINQREDSPASAEFLHLMPNRPKAGKKITAEFCLESRVAPEITLVNIGHGDVVRQISPAELTVVNGCGTAQVETAGLASGVYLVRVRSGEKQLTGKVEVQ